MNGSYLTSSYLGDTTITQETGLPAQNVPMVVDQQDELIELPGGIVLPKRTLLFIAAGIVLAYFLVKQKKKSD